MTNTIKFAILVSACSHAAGCAAYSRMGEVVVTRSGSQPCFGLENTVATRQGQHRLWSIAVYRRSGDDPRPVWAFTLPPQSPVRFIVPPACVPYGEAPVEAAVSASPAALEPGVLYTVSMGARGSDASDPTLSYSGEFCLVRKAGQPTTVHQVQWDAKAGKWQRDVCLEK